MGQALIAAGEDIAGDHHRVRLLGVDQLHHALGGGQLRIDAQVQIPDQHQLHVLAGLVHLDVIAIYHRVLGVNQPVAGDRQRHGQGKAQYAAIPVLCNPPPAEPPDQQHHPQQHQQQEAEVQVKAQPYVARSLERKLDGTVRQERPRDRHQRQYDVRYQPEQLAQADIPGGTGPAPQAQVDHIGSQGSQRDKDGNQYDG